MAEATKSIVITGASSGIGRATALRLARNGWRVFATVRKDTDAEQIEAKAVGALETVRLDVGDKDSIAAAAAEVESRLNGRGLDGLFNNAGIGSVAPVEHTSLDALRHVYEINLFGQIATIQTFLPLVRKAKGRIVNAGSVGDHLTPPFAGALASSKAAFASMSAALRLELRSQGIHVCVIEPGSINTPAVEKTLGDVEKTIAGLPPEARSLYGESLRRMVSAFARAERAGSSPEIVAKVVERALTDRRPRTRYPAGKDSAKLATLARLLPEKLLDRAVLKTFGLPTAFGKATT
jgi:NAD(P)-dependent dehydrogenase (short-subunit alcohol dehydrogenase family)